MADDRRRVEFDLLSCVAYSADCRALLVDRVSIADFKDPAIAGVLDWICYHHGDVVGFEDTDTMGDPALDAVVKKLKTEPPQATPTAEGFDALIERFRATPEPAMTGRPAPEPTPSAQERAQPPAKAERREKPSKTPKSILWLNQVALDAELPAAAFKLAFALSQLFGKTGFAWPSQGRLASVLHIERSTIRRLVKALVQREHLQVSVGRGRGHSTHYTPIIKQPPVERLFSPENRAKPR
jgi:hypothetical protein